MNHTQSPLETLNEIRDLMNKSSRFLSLSGLSGIWAGTSALAGGIVAQIYLDINIFSQYKQVGLYSDGSLDKDFLWFCLIDGLLVLITALSGAIYFTTRNARRTGQPIWNNTARRAVLNLFLPLLAGGLFCLALATHHFTVLVAPATLMFYGLALLNASKYTLHDIRYLAISEIVLGLLASLFIGYGLLFWIIGFGILHIIYGAFMYFKYER